MNHRCHPFCSDVILFRSVSSSCSRRHRQYKHMFGVSQYIAVVSPTALCWYFARHCCYHRNFNFLRAAFFVSLKSSSFGSIKNIPLNCLALLSFGFSITHLCFALLCFLLFASDINFHISSQTSSGGLSFGRTTLVHPSDNSFSPSTFQQHSLNLFFKHYVQ